MTVDVLGRMQESTGVIKRPATYYGLPNYIEPIFELR